MTDFTDDTSSYTSTTGTRMDNLRWDEVSGVDMPAHLTPGWMVMKSSSSPGTTRHPTEEGLVPDDTITGEGDADHDEVEINKAALAPEIRAYIEELESQVAKAAEDASPDEADTDPLAKALDSLPEPVRKHLADMDARVEVAEAVAKAEQDKRLTSEFVAKAAEWEHLPGNDPAELGPVLRKAAEALGEEALPIFDVLKAADEAIASSDVFASVGSDRPTSTAGSAYEKVEALAKSAMQDDEELTFAQAMAKAAIENPDLYGDYLAENGQRDPMAFEASQPLKDGTRVAGEDLSSAQYHFVTLESDGEIDLADAATDRPYGVLQNNPTAGQPCEIVLIGFTKIVQSAAINPGVIIGTNADGEADAKVVGTDVTEFNVGMMIHDGGADQAVGTAVVNCVSATQAVTGD